MSDTDGDDEVYYEQLNTLLDGGNEDVIVDLVTKRDVCDDVFDDAIREGNMRMVSFLLRNNFTNESSLNLETEYTPEDGIVKLVGELLEILGDSTRDIYQVILDEEVSSTTFSYITTLLHHLRIRDLGIMGGDNIYSKLQLISALQTSTSTLEEISIHLTDDYDEVVGLFNLIEESPHLTSLLVRCETSHHAPYMFDRLTSMGRRFGSITIFVPYSDEANEAFVRMVGANITKSACISKEYKWTPELINAIAQAPDVQYVYVGMDSTSHSASAVYRRKLAAKVVVWCDVITPHVIDVYRLNE